MSSSGAESSRFTHLLQPIRDLSKNWNIDLAQELEEYLDELEHLHIAFDPTDDAAPVGVAAGTRLAQANAAANTARVMNFAEAALLIQGTSVIYSRKVEYLYALVFQTLAHLTRPQDTAATRTGGTSNGNGDGNADGDGDGDEANDNSNSQAHDVFLNPLPLLDELDEARNITLKSITTDAQRQRAAAKSSTTIQASISLMGSLIPNERDHGETFKLLSCNLHASGVLLLDEASKKYLDGRDHAMDQDSTDRGFGAGSRSSDGPVAALNFDDVADDFFMDDRDGGADDHDVDYGYNDDGDAGGEPIGDGRDGVDIDATAGTDDNINDYDGDNDGDNGSGQLASPEKPVATRSRRQQEVDPWTPLDPYDASTAMSRPFRKGRSYPKPKKSKKSPANDDDDTVVDGLDDPQFISRFFAGATHRSQWTSWVWSETTTDMALERRFAKRFCNAPVLVKSVDALWRLERKWKLLVQRQAAKDEQSAQAMLLHEQADEDDETQQIDVTVASGVTNALDLDLNVHSDNDDDGDDNGFDDNGFDNDDDNSVPYELGGSNSHDWDTVSSQAIALPTTTFDADGSSQHPQSYEDICRQHIASFLQGAEQYKRETYVNKQVSDWQATLAPMLAAQDAQPPFDIRTYGRTILQHLVDDTTVKREEEEIDDVRTDMPVPFSALVGGLQPFEVGRMFLATLQLANSGNVQLVHGVSAGDRSCVPFQMTLRSTANVYEALQ